MENDKQDNRPFQEINPQDHSSTIQQAQVTRPVLNNPTQVDQSIIPNLGSVQTPKSPSQLSGFIRFVGAAFLASAVSLILSMSLLSTNALRNSVGSCRNKSEAWGSLNCFILYTYLSLAVVTVITLVAFFLFMRLLKVKNAFKLVVVLLFIGAPLIGLSSQANIPDPVSLLMPLVVMGMTYTWVNWRPLNRVLLLLVLTIIYALLIGISFIYIQSAKKEIIKSQLQRKAELKTELINKIDFTAYAPQMTPTGYNDYSISLGSLNSQALELTYMKALESDTKKRPINLTEVKAPINGKQIDCGISVAKLTSYFSNPKFIVPCQNISPSNPDIYYSEINDLSNSRYISASTVKDGTLIVFTYNPEYSDKQSYKDFVQNLFSNLQQIK